MVNAEQVQYRGVDVVDIEAGNRFPSPFITFPAGDAPANAGTGHPADRSAAVVIAPMSALCKRHPAEFCGPDNQRVFEHTTCFQVLKQCGDDLTRENVMKQAANIKGFTPSLALPGIKITTGPNDYRVNKQMQMMKFNGERWELFGPIIEDTGPSG